MDFITRLPLSFGKSVIYVTVDRLSKAAHFVALKHPYSALTVAQAYYDHIFKLHGDPRSIVSDRDSVFVSEFWQELFNIQGIELKMSSAYHPQTDGQTEAVNKCLESYLRCMTCDKPQLWSKYLPLTEFWYNTTFHSATQLTPYEVVCGQSPPLRLPYLPGETKVEAVARSLEDRGEMIKLLKFHILRSQHRMEQLANSHRSERYFAPGDYVYIKLQPYRQHSVVSRASNKLSPRYFGPYKVLDRVGSVAYKIEFPAGSQIHPIFHISELKQHIGNIPTSTSLPPFPSNAAAKEPEAIIDRRMVKRQGAAATQVLIKWKDTPVEESTWEYLYDLLEKYPNFNS